MGKPKLIERTRENVSVALFDNVNQKIVEYNARYKSQIEAGKKTALNQRVLAKKVFSREAITDHRKYSKLNRMLNGHDNMPLQVAAQLAQILETTLNELLMDSNF